MRELADRVVVVTGASSGIGAATARACAAAGMHVVLIARRAERLGAVAAACQEYGGRALSIPIDVAGAGASDEILGRAMKEYGRVDVVVANAGYGTRIGLLDMSELDLRTMFEVNFFAALSLCRAAARLWISAAQPGHLIMSSSCVGKFPLAYHGAYCATKASQAMACAALRAELQAHRIAVSSVHPVTTRTEFFLESDRRSGSDGLGVEVPDHAPRFLVQSPERVAAAVVRCMHRPVPEVWTSSLVRLSAALFTACPWVLHQVLDHQARKERQQDARSRNSDPSAPA
ncbi:MAG: SDR family oxidoreductase [Phycisphaerae bacterium]|nr:SDR family oxidoreductase [Phycisphaerae bacterium]